MEKVTFRNCTKSSLKVFFQGKELPLLYSGHEDWLILPLGNQQIEIQGRLFFWRKRKEMHTIDVKEGNHVMAVYMDKYVQRYLSIASLLAFFVISVLPLGTFIFNFSSYIIFPTLNDLKLFNFHWSFINWLLGNIFYVFFFIKGFRRYKSLEHVFIVDKMNS